MCQCGTAVGCSLIQIEVFLFMGLFLTNCITFMKELNIVIFYSVQSFTFVCRV
jgi:hypothetical protein